jgi:hypothetical protein
MTLLVTLDQAKAHLRVDHDADDDDITFKIEAASQAILNYLGEAAYEFTDTGGEVLEDSSGILTPRIVQYATLLLVGDFYMHREPTASDMVPVSYGYGYLPRAVIALLYNLRPPTIV